MGGCGSSSRRGRRRRRSRCCTGSSSTPAAVTASRPTPAADVDQIKHTYSGSFDFYWPEEVWALVRATGSEQDSAIILTAASPASAAARSSRSVSATSTSRTARSGWRAASPTASARRRSRGGAVGADGAGGREGARRAPQRPRRPRPRRARVPGADGYLDASALRRRYTRAQRRAGLRRLRFHDLRHTFGSLAVSRASIVQLQTWMGHADVKTTMRYLHHKSHAAEADLLDGAFAPAQPAVIEQPATAATVAAIS